MLQNSELFLFSWMEGGIPTALYQSLIMHLFTLAAACCLASMTSSSFSIRDSDSITITRGRGQGEGKGKGREKGGYGEDGRGQNLITNNHPVLATIANLVA